MIKTVAGEIGRAGNTEKENVKKRVWNMCMDISGKG